MSKRKDVIREGDRVRIIKPDMYIRCGYPLTIQMVKDQFITAEHKEAIRTMLRAFGVSPTVTNPFALDPNRDEKVESKILFEMARVILRQKQWGGHKREVYTEYQPAFLNATGRVANKFIVKSGEYESGSKSYDDYYGGYEYELPQLLNSKTHVILEVYSDGDNEKVLCGYKMQVERCNVEKI